MYVTQTSQPTAHISRGVRAGDVPNHFAAHVGTACFMAELGRQLEILQSRYTCTVANSRGRDMLPEWSATYICHEICYRRGLNMTPGARGNAQPMDNITRYCRSLQEGLRRANVNLESWYESAQDRDAWRAVIHTIK